MNFLSSGSYLFDRALGQGFPFGKIVNLIGDKSTGKTLIACETIAQAKMMYGNKVKWFYDDAEAGFSFNTEQIYGFQMLSDDRKPSETMEELDYNLDSCLKTVKDDEFFIYILDSFDSLSSEEEMELVEKRRAAIEKDKDFDEGSYMLKKNKLFNQFFRTQRQKIKNRNCMLMIISQIRDNIGVTFGKKYKRYGGKALDFYAAQVVWLSEAEKYMTKDERSYGIGVKAYVEKNKVSKPFRTCFFDIRFDYGIDNTLSNVHYLYNLRDGWGKIKTGKKMPKIDWSKKKQDGTDEILSFDSPEKLALWIERNNLNNTLQEKVGKMWDELDYATTIESTGRCSKFDLMKQVYKNIPPPIIEQNEKEAQKKAVGRPKSK